MAAPAGGGLAATGTSVVVPVYRSKATLSELVARVLAQFAADEPVEIVLVEDDGGDGSWDLVRSLALADPRVRGIRHRRNAGQHAALLTGIRAARHPVVVTLDDDLQHRPEDIPRLLAALSPGVDVVYGVPQERAHGLWRNVGSAALRLALSSAMGAETARIASAFRAFRTDLRDAFVDHSGPSIVIDVLLTWGTTRFASVPVQHDARRQGRSNYSVRMLVRHALNMATGLSVLPLKIASAFGVVLSLLGIVLLGWVLVRYALYGSEVAGFPFLASMIALFSGAQMFALGVLGEYVARIHQGGMGRLHAVVRETTGAPERAG
jgi:undecaprenyl-phosphate 4-deoxy-4-formamido-L-arabinose transferase